MVDKPSHHDVLIPSQGGCAQLAHVGGRGLGVPRLPTMESGPPAPAYFFRAIHLGAPGSHVLHNFAHWVTSLKIIIVSLLYSYFNFKADTFINLFVLFKQTTYYEFINIYYHIFFFSHERGNLTLFYLESILIHCVRHFILCHMEKEFSWLFFSGVEYPLFIVL